MHREGDVQDGWRLPARHLEEVVLGALKRFLSEGTQLTQALDLSRASPQRLKVLLDQAQQVGTELSIENPGACRQLLEHIMERITLGSATLSIELRRGSLTGIATAGDGEGDADPERLYDLVVPISARRRGVEAKLILGDGYAATSPDDALISLLRIAHRRWQRLVTREVESLKQLAREERVDASDIGRTLHLAFLSPHAIDAILSGRQPLGLTARHLKRIGHLPAEWSHQKTILGIDQATA